MSQSTESVALSLPSLETLPETFVHRNFRIRKLLGSGSFGQVYEVEARKYPKRIYAVKYVVRSEFLIEKYYLTRLRHKHVVQLIESVMDEYMNEEGSRIEIGFLFMEKCRINLIGRMLEIDKIAGPSRRIMTQMCRDLMQQIATGVEYLHRQLILHRDLKPDNILIDSSGCVKLADFGMAVSADRCQSFDVVTLWYRAPEILYRKPYDYAIDCWSLGCIFGEMLMGGPLMPGADRVNQKSLIIHRCSNELLLPDQPLRRLYWQVIEFFGWRRYIRKNIVRRLFAKYRNYKMADLIDGLLEIEASSRYKIADVVNHPFFTTSSDLRYF